MQHSFALTLRRYGNRVSIKESCFLEPEKDYRGRSPFVHVEKPSTLETLQEDLNMLRFNLSHSRLGISTVLEETGELFTYVLYVSPVSLTEGRGYCTGNFYQLRKYACVIRLSHALVRGPPAL